MNNMRLMEFLISDQEHNTKFDAEYLHRSNIRNQSAFRNDKELDSINIERVL